MIAALLGAMAWTGCANIEEELVKEEPETIAEQAEGAQVWNVRLQATKSDGPDTKGLDIEGDEATTTVLKSVWEDGEEVKVFLEGSLIGTLAATPDGSDAHKAVLSGKITTTSIVAGTTTLTLLTPREAWDYTRRYKRALSSRLKSIFRIFVYHERRTEYQSAAAACHEGETAAAKCLQKGHPQAARCG